MAADPYRYFRPEARELLDGIAKGVLDLEKGEAVKETVARLLRLAHTLKGAARVVKQIEVADHAHAVEELLGPHRDGTALPRARIDELLRCCDGISTALQALDRPAPIETTTRAAEPRVAEAEDTVRIEIGEMDALLAGIAETGVQLGALGRRRSQLQRGRALARDLRQRLREHPELILLADELEGALETAEQDLDGGVAQVERELAQVRDSADRMRLVPAQVLFSSLERAVRDAAQALQRRVELRVSGGEHRADANVLSRVGAALLQLVRNAVAHGIEDQRGGKPAVGVVEIAVERRGARLAFACRDDGRGIDVEAVRGAAIRRGLMSEVEARKLGFDQVVQLLLHGGVSTAAVATQAAGRGVGLDVVRAVAGQLGGEIAVRSGAGKGTTVELLVPITLSSVMALRVSAGGSLVLVPLDSVARVISVEPKALSHSGGRQSIEVDGQTIPYLPMWQALRRDSGAACRCAVVVRAGESLTAVGVDELLGAAEVVVRALPAAAAAEPVVMGAALDAEGDPCLMVAPDELAAAARLERTQPVQAPAPPRAPVLVVDDSLTTRMLEQSILESAGYEVEVAASAEEALEKARARRYRLFLVDVEMPGMSGFDFVQLTRSDPELREIPAMLVTSRNAPEDKRRGMEVGARAYIVKGDFDQGRLLDTIRGLIGEARR